MSLTEAKVVLFSAGSFRAFEMCTEDIAALQRFFEANPEYHWMVGGQAPRGDEAEQTFSAMPPAGWSFKRKWMLCFADVDGSMIGVADVISELLTEGVWHVGLFMVATALHGSGAAPLLYAHLESWMRSRGARWLRLGVVEGNKRAERLWESVGYVEVRKRHGVEMEQRVNTLRVMVKSLANGALVDYLAMVARDRPEHGS